MARRRIDWEEELKKTERTRIRGFKITFLSFALTALFFMCFRFQGSRARIPLYVLIVLFGLLGVLLLFRRKT
ncbi:MAG: hypothetical protein GX487_05305 [Acetomicrobium flavidum]|uniref:hypothetical protein n=1 Tax=Acetomicrobium flavidum TaxID=49896 RepID=UPI001178B449|nr:hypothetical protein [Acetomicrobium flavidum]